MHNMCHLKKNIILSDADLQNLFQTLDNFVASETENVAYSINKGLGNAAAVLSGEVFMKVFFKYGFSAYSGMVDRMVYQAWFQGRLCLARRFTYPIITENNVKLGKIGSNLALVYRAASEFYIDDLKSYTQRNSRENKPRNIDLWHPMPSSVALFVLMMYNWYLSDPQHIDLTTVTVADIVAMDADVRTIARAVTAGFLRKVRVYADLTADIQ